MAFASMEEVLHLQWKKSYIYNIECKSSSLHKNIMKISFSIPSIINKLSGDNLSLMKCE